MLKNKWIYWLYQARTRYQLCVLNYMITSNHIHLLVKDNGENNIPKSMQLIASRTALEYNQWKRRKGLFREDPYHTTAIETEYLMDVLCISVVE